MMGSVACVPVPCPCGKHKRQRGLGNYQVHRKGDPCSTAKFVIDGAPWLSCCALLATPAAHNLAALGEQELAERFYREMTAEDAVAFAHDLRAAADRLEDQETGDAHEPRGAVLEVHWDRKKRSWGPHLWEPLSIAIDLVLEASDWFWFVGRRGFAVHPR